MTADGSLPPARPGPEEEDPTPRSEAQRAAAVRATLARIRIAGFKSFAEATTVEVLPGLTGIVGPNGCGKSNVVEALRWAMGETSAKAMRGGEMDDVIFAGTATRPGRNLAEVTLNLEEAEGLAPPPNQDRRVTPTSAPTAAAMVPEVGVSAFAVMRSRPCTTWGSEADSPASTKRPIPSTTSTVTPSQKPSFPTRTSTMIGTVNRALSRFARTSTTWRRHRSRNTPANGPTIE